MQDFRKLYVWQKAHALTLEVYKAKANFPKEELFGLTRQLRRACASIPANIAEGCGRGTDADFARFLTIAMGSASETEYYLVLGRDLRLLDKAQCKSLDARTTEVKRMLVALIRRTKTNARRLTAES